MNGNLPKCVLSESFPILIAPSFPSSGLEDHTL